jgi:hypothetical protein
MFVNSFHREDAMNARDREEVECRYSLAQLCVPCACGKGIQLIFSTYVFNNSTNR